MKTRSLYALTALIGAAAFTVPWLTRLAAQNSPIGQYSMSEWAHYQLNVNRVLETGQVGKVIGYTSNGVVGVIEGGGGGIPEAPLGTALYARSNALWQAFPPGLATMQTDAPDNGLWYARRDNEWQNFVPGGGTGTNTGGTNRILLAALAEFREPDTNGTLLPANTATFIRLNHIFDPDGLVTQIDTNAGSFRLTAGNYALTMVVPVSVAEQGGGNVRIPFTIGLFNLTTTNDVYYQTYTLYDEDLSQYSQIFMPALITDGLQDFTIRVFNHSTILDLVAGQAGGVAGLENHYTELQMLKLDGFAGLPEAPINDLMYARSNQDWVSFTPGGSGGDGADTNAVASVPDIAALANLTEYTKAIVGQTNETVQKLFQKVPVLTVPTNEWISATVQADLVFDPAAGVAYSTNNPTTGNQVLGVQFGSIEINQTYTFGFWARSNEDTVQLDYPNWNPGFVWHTPKTMTTEWAYYAVTFSSSVNIGAYFWRDGADASTDFYMVRDVVGYTEASGYFVASYSESGYGWQQVSLEGSGGAAQTTNQVFVTGTGYDSPYQFVPTANTIWVTDISDPGLSDVTFTNKPVILPGVEGQYLIITNGTPRGFRFPRDSNPTLTDSGVWSPTATYVITPGYVGYFRYRTDEGLWDAYGTWPIILTGLEATLLPAPWEPPDDDGHQVIREDVQDALIDALLPRLLQRLGGSAGTLPAPAPRRLGKPGTRDNPLDWPAPAPSSPAAGKYNVTIKIGDQ